MKKPLIPVTDHAVIRYLERVLHINIEAHRREIGRRVDRAAELGAAAVVLDGHRYIITDGAVTTIMFASKPNLRTGRVRRERPDGGAE